MTDKFDEQALLADIIKVWGEYGAHADLTRWMIAEIQRLRAALDAEGNESNLLMLEIKRLRAAGDALHAAISALPIQRFDEGLAVINAMHDWDGVRNA